MTDGLRSKSESFSMWVKSTLLSLSCINPIAQPGRCHGAMPLLALVPVLPQCWAQHITIPLLSALSVPGPHLLRQGSPSVPLGPGQNKGCSFLVLPTLSCSRKRDPAEPCSCRKQWNAFGSSQGAGKLHLQRNFPAGAQHTTAAVHLFTQEW